MSQTRRLSAILAADVAGYSRLMGADEEGTHEHLMAHFRELVDPKIEEHHGRSSAARPHLAGMSSVARTAAIAASPTTRALWADQIMGSWRAGIGIFSVNCTGLCLHNSAVLRPRPLGHRWPVTNGDEHVGDLLLGIEDAGASAERAERTIP